MARAMLWPLASLSERLGNRFYTGLAAVVLGVALYGVAGGYTGGMKHQAYDFILKNRFHAPAPDTDLVLIDIDEASLAAMAPEYGRWPWPRAVMAELTEALARENPAALVYDITFSDLDLDHPDGDRYFRDVAARYRDTYFAMIRLNPENDAASELRLARLAGAQPLRRDAPRDATVAMVVPYFWDVLDGRRLGTNNLYTDDDGIARAYHVYLEAHDWRIYSLPANVVAALGGELPERRQILLNWRGPYPSYAAVSFHEVYRRILKGESAGPFAGKVIVIGSTAPSLFDLKPTPMAQNHPGVEILLTALDNLKNGDYLTELPAWAYLLITVLAIVLLALAFVYNVDPLWLYTLFTVMQTAFLGVTYLFLNYSTWFVDLTAPFTAALAYFFIARLYRRVLVGRRNGNPIYSTALDPGQSCETFLIACRFLSSRQQARITRVLQREAGLTRYGVSAARPFAGAQLLDSVYDDTMLFYWLVPPERRCDALADLDGMLTRCAEARHVRDATADVRLALHAVRFTIDDEHRWREHGKNAVIEVLQLASRGTETLSVTPAFVQMQDGCPTIFGSPTLRALGLPGAAQAPG
jgi:adenylate cyclase